MKTWDSEKTRWDKARGMYELNKSFREIEAELHIPRSSLHRRALYEGWEKGSLLPLVNEMVRVETLLQQLTPKEREKVKHEINRKRRLEEIYQDNPNKWLKKLMK